jgi:16S rRNA (adenine1518-N6/adenine1519-N6)-dimethyltransferase
LISPKLLLKQYNLHPSRHLGQNFLTDKSALNKIISAADLSPDDTILEVGPGLGVLTLELAKRAKKIIAAEKDRKMAEILKHVLDDENIKNVEIIEGDILKLLASLNRTAITGKADLNFQLLNKLLITNYQSQNYKLVANIPYYLTSPLIRKFLETENQPSLIVLLIQKEVAQRICAKPPKMSLLSVATQFYAEPKIISYVSRKSFYPQPKVDSAIIRISPRATEIESLGRDSISNFFKLAKAGFAHPRKQLINNLSAGLDINREEIEKILLESNLKPTMRPSELSVDKWVELTWNIWGK